MTKKSIPLGPRLRGDDVEGRAREVRVSIPTPLMTVPVGRAHPHANPSPAISNAWNRAYTWGAKLFIFSVHPNESWDPVTQKYQVSETGFILEASAPHPNPSDICGEMRDTGSLL